MALTMIAMPNRPKLNRLSQGSTLRIANSAEIPAITRTIVGTGAGHVILFGEYLSQ